MYADACQKQMAQHPVATKTLTTAAPVAMPIVRAVAVPTMRTGVSPATDALLMDKSAAKKVENLVGAIEQQNRQAAAKKSEAAQIAQRYSFAPWQPPAAGYYPSEIISMDEFRAHPERYAHRLAKGMLGFPLGLSFKEINSGLFEAGYHGSGVHKIGVEISLKNILHFCSSDVKDVSNLLVNALYDAGLCREDSSSFFNTTSPLDFLANAGRIARFVNDRPELSENQKKHVRDYLLIAQSVYLAALELVGTARIGDPLELAAAKGTPVPPATTLADKLKDVLLAEPEHTGEEAVNNLFPLQSKKSFRGLALERTADILFKGKRPVQLERAIEQELKKYSTGRLLCLAAYFSRFAIQQYENHDQAVERVLAGGTMQKMSGQCFHYTALAAHYLLQVLMPMLPDAFHGFRIGYEEDHIGQQYRHVYLKALRVNPDRSVDAYFLDPTFLARQGIKALATPESIAKYAGTTNHPVQITRTAEDLLQRPGHGQQVIDVGRVPASAQQRQMYATPPARQLKA